MHRCCAKSVPACMCVLTRGLSRRFEAILRGHSATVTCLAAPLDGSFLLSGSTDQEVHTYDFAKVHARRLRSTHSFEPRAPNEVVSLALNPHVRCGRFDAARGFDTRHIALVATIGVCVCTRVQVWCRWGSSVLVPESVRERGGVERRETRTMCL
jgi:hypothetical protein